MGRGKLKMQMIQNEKARLVTFQKRKQGLVKKLHELTTLCAVPACMIMHHASQDSVWLENFPDEVRRLVDAYSKSKNKSLCAASKTYGLSDFFDHRHKEIEGELLKLRKKNSEAKYPTWSHCFSAMDESQLRNLGAQLRLKAQSLKSRIQLLREKSKAMNNYDPQFYDLGMMQQHNDFNFFSSSSAAAAAQIPINYYHDLPPLPPQQHYPPLAMDQHGNYYFMDQNLNSWLLP